jgi:hypothetical protein
MSAITGGCECGRIRYTVQEATKDVAWCYCKQCQRVSGAPFIAFATYDSSNVTWTHDPDVFVSSDIGERDYCKDCGSTLGMRYYFQPYKLAIALGTVDNRCDVSKGPSIHIFLKDKPMWFNVPDDGAKQYQTHQTDNDFSQKLEQWQADRKPQK